MKDVNETVNKAVKETVKLWDLDQMEDGDLLSDVEMALEEIFRLGICVGGLNQELFKEVLSEQIEKTDISFLDY